MKQRRYFLLGVALAAAAATPAFGQAVAPTVSPANSGKESAAPIPDFSGIWVHSIPGFEPLPSGPTSLVNRSRRNGIGNLLELVGDYTNPILKPEAAQVVKRHGEISSRGIGYPTPRNQCWPGGVPFVFPSGATQLLQRPDKITILYNYDHQVRQVRLNQAHPAHVTPSWYGDSVGHYEGDTLIIDTVGIDIGCLITKPRKRGWNGTQRKINSPRGSGTRTMWASICSSNSRSRTKASSRRRGPRP